MHKILPMKLITRKNIHIDNPETRPFLADAFYPDTEGKLPLVIFAHGYKGYKDWGAWDLMAEKIAAAGFYFVKFNFSHNGTTPERPTEFADLEAFGQNNFSKEMLDYDAVIGHFAADKKADADKIAIIGHSRGGGISVIKGYEDERVKAIVSLAGVSHFGYRFPSQQRLEDWEKEGVMYTENKRTGQKMPHYYQFYEDYKANEERFNIQYAAQHALKPFLVIEAGADETVKNNESELLHQWAKESEYVNIEGASHTFGASEPWENQEMPRELKEATDAVISFLKKSL